MGPNVRYYLVNFDGAVSNKLKLDENRYQCFLGGYNLKTRRGEVYLFTENVKKIYDRSSEIVTKAKQGKLYGEKDHPNLSFISDKNEAIRRVFSIDPSNISHRITDIELIYIPKSKIKKKIPHLDQHVLEPGLWGVKGIIEPQGEKGEELKEKFEKDDTVSFSARSIFKISHVNGTPYAECMRVITWDWVSVPNIPFADSQNTSLMIDGQKGLAVQLDSYISSITYIELDAKELENFLTIEEKKRKGILDWI